MPFSRSFSVWRTYIFWLRSNCCGTSHNIYNSVCLSSTKPKKFCCHKQKTKQAPKTKQHSLLLSTVRKTVHGVVRVASFSKPLPSALMHLCPNISTVFQASSPEPSGSMAGKGRELATTSLEFEFHLQFPCGFPSTKLSDFRQSAQSGNKRECKQKLTKMCQV